MKKKLVGIVSTKDWEKELENEKKERLKSYKKLFLYAKKLDCFDLNPNYHGFTVEVIPRVQPDKLRYKHVLTVFDPEVNPFVDTLIEEAVEYIRKMVQDDYFDDENLINEGPLSNREHTYFVRIIFNGKLIYSNSLWDRCR